jgi:hypothetical protein
MIHVSKGGASHMPDAIPHMHVYVLLHIPSGFVFTDMCFLSCNLLRSISPLAGSRSQAGWPVSGGVLWELHGA